MPPCSSQGAEEPGVNLDDRMREAIVDGLKAEANALCLTGDAFWLHVWAGIDAACRESGDLPRLRGPRASPKATPGARTRSA